MSCVSKFATVVYINMPGTPNPPTVSGSYGFVIPQARTIVRIDPDRVLSEAPKSIEYDLKSLEQDERLKEQGLEIFRTKYYLRKDCYSMIISQRFNRIVLCNTNELTMIKSEASLVTNEEIEVEEHS